MKPDSTEKSSLAEQLEQAIVRPSGRETDQMREVSFKAGIAPHANGSVLCSFGNTQVICAAMIEDGVREFDEMAPGKVLKGLMRRVDREAKVETHDEPKTVTMD